MPTLPDPPNEGEPLRAAWGRKLLAFVRSLTPTSSPDIAPEWDANGLSWKIKNPGRRGGSAAPEHSYQVYDASTGATPRIRVRPGNHNGIVPTIGGTPINTTTGDPAEYPALTVGTGDTIVWFKLTITEEGNIDTIEIESGSTLPTSSASTAYQVCAYITVAIAGGVASVTNQEGGVSGSQAYLQCGGGHLFGLV
ncbi:hypothetical protein DB346_03025 [Verrucomicrobia bacterium LW23]|nr:hypothetical protein DB346_03630 [Verrucomicrobia bacterium LW23]PTY04422.1 hypothetical protein DB346_03025 [Verrucomicrobia bacterium LW23]